MWSALLSPGTKLDHTSTSFSTFGNLSSLWPRFPPHLSECSSRSSLGRLWSDHSLSWEPAAVPLVPLCLAEWIKSYLDVSKRKRKRIEGGEHRGLMVDDIGKADPSPLYDFLRLQGFLMRIEQSFPSVQIRLLGLKTENLINPLRIVKNLRLISDKLRIISEVSLRLPILMIGSSPFEHFCLWYLGSSTLGWSHLVPNGPI